MSGPCTCNHVLVAKRMLFVVSKKADNVHVFN